MILKEGVIMNGLQVQMRVVLVIAGNYFEHLINKDFIITSALDGTHSARSYHYYGYAVDIATKHLTDEEIKGLKKHLDFHLSEVYDTVIEKDHVHVEYDLIKAGKL